MLDWKKLSIDEVYTAFSMEEAIGQFTAHPIELLLTDIEMPDGTGLDLIQWCNTRHLPCTSIILSGYPNFHFAQRAITLGVFEYLLKPVSDSKLEEALKKAVNAIRTQTPSAAQDTDNALISNIKTYIYEHISLEISRNDIAAHVNLSPAYLSTFFKKETGTTINDFIRQERINFAKRLLKQTNLPVTMIAQNVGYNSMAYFSSTFRALTGCTPREYRSSHEAL